MFYLIVMCCISKLYILVLQTYCFAEIANYNNITIEEDPNNVEHYMHRSFYYDKPTYSSGYYEKPTHNSSGSYDKKLYNRNWYYKKSMFNRSRYYDKSTFNRYYDKPSYNRTKYYDHSKYNRTKYYDRTTYNRTWYYNKPYRRFLRTKQPFTLNNTIFMTLFNHEVQTHPVTQAAYPWIAAVVHTTTGVLPFVCTASLIEKGIFITAARCIYKLKIVQTRVLYKDTKLTVKVFVIPSPPTKQMFDDVGLIVVTDENFKGAWTPVKLFSGKRTDNEFDWFFKLRTQRTSDHKVVGYAHAKHTYDAILPPATPTRLTELPVTVGIAMCKQIFANIKINGFYVPCYSGCTIAEFIKHDPKCERYHGSLGGAVYNFKTKELLGVATWGAANSRRTLPVGFAVPNSDNFKKDLACARKINSNKHPNPPKGYYQKLCL